MNARERAAQAAAEGDTARAAYWSRIADVVDQAPPLSDGQKARLRILLRPAIVDEALAPIRSTA